MYNSANNKTMSWFTDLAGKAENLLNKIDQNAAVVLKDKTSINEQLTDVIWNSTSLKRASTNEDVAPSTQFIPTNAPLFPPLIRSSPSGAPSPTLRSSPPSDISYRRSDEEDLLQLLNHSENVLSGMQVEVDEEDARGSPSGASIPPSPVPSGGHSRCHSQVSSSCLKDDSIPQHCFKPVKTSQEIDSYVRGEGGNVPYADVSAENNMLKNEIRCLNNEVTLLHQRCKAAEKEVGVAGKELQALKELQSANENLHKEVCSLQSQLCNKEKEWLAINVNSMSSGLRSELITVQEKNEKLQAQNERIIEESKDLHLKVSRLQSALCEAGLQSDRHRQQLQAVTQEAEHFRARATRVLQDKERLIASLQDGDHRKGDFNTDVLEQEVEQLREEIRLLRLETTSQAELLQVARQDLQNLEFQSEQTRLSLDAEIERLQDRLQEERTCRASAEEDYRGQSEELRKARSEHSQHNELLKKRVQEMEVEIAHLQDQISYFNNSSQGNSNSRELEARVRHLATALMQKQGALEALIAERNALLLQLEKNGKKKKLSPLVQSSCGTVVSVNETDNTLRSRVPTLMAESPTDNEVARRVKRAYSNLDKLGIGVGVFLRRYPLARILVICYMVMLHFWVALVLFTYTPESHSPLQIVEIPPVVSPKEPKVLQ